MVVTGATGISRLATMATTFLPVESSKEIQDLACGISHHCDTAAAFRKAMMDPMFQPGIQKSRNFTTETKPWLKLVLSVFALGKHISFQGF